MWRCGGCDFDDGQEKKGTTGNGMGEQAVNNQQLRTTAITTTTTTTTWDEDAGDGVGEQTLNNQKDEGRG